MGNIQHLAVRLSRTASQLVKGYTGSTRLISLTIMVLALLALSFLVPSSAQAKTVQGSSISRQQIVEKAMPANGPCQYGPTIDYNCLKNTDPHAGNAEVPQGNVNNPISAGSLLYFYTPFEVTADHPLVRNLWAIMLFIVDMGGGVMLMLSGLKVMLAGSVFRYANAIESLPGVVLGLVSAHLSLLIVVFFLGLNNMLSLGLYNIAETNPALARTHATFTVPTGPSLCQQQNPGVLGTIGCTVSVWVSQALGNGAGTGAPTPVAVDPTTGASMLSIAPPSLEFTNIWDNLKSLTDILGFMIKVLGLMLLAQLIIRLFFINLYIVFSPLGIAAWALPGKAGQPLTKMWLTGFISIVMVQFVQVAALVITQIMIGAIANYVHTQVSDQVLSATTLVGVLRVAVLWFVIRIPSLLGTAPMRTIIETGQSMQQVVGATIAIQMTEAQAVASLASSVGGAGLSLLAR